MGGYVASLAAGILVGAIYALLGVRSPAPPMMALCGLLGILLGEQTVPLLRHALATHSVDRAWFHREAAPHVLGKLPTGQSASLTCGLPQVVGETSDET